MEGLENSTSQTPTLPSTTNSNQSSSVSSNQSPFLDDQQAERFGKVATAAIAAHEILDKNVEQVASTATQLTQAVAGLNAKEDAALILKAGQQLATQLNGARLEAIDNDPSSSRFAKMVRKAGVGASQVMVTELKSEDVTAALEKVQPVIGKVTESNVKAAILGAKVVSGNASTEDKQQVKDAATDYLVAKAETITLRDVASLAKTGYDILTTKGVAGNLLKSWWGGWGTSSPAPTVRVEELENSSTTSSSSSSSQPSASSQGAVRPTGSSNYATVNEEGELLFPSLREDKKSS